MTGSSVSDTKSPSCSGSVCSEDKATDVECSFSEKEKLKNSVESDSYKSDATYTKYTRQVTINKPVRTVSYDFLKNKSIDFTRPRPISSLNQQRIKRQNGIRDPTTHYSKHAQWLAWNDPVFTRRRSIEEQRICKHTSTSSKTNEDQKSTVASFKRSLQLLGLKEKDLGLTENTTQKNNDNQIPRGRATPTFSTQLKQRSVSLTNLRNAVQESGLPTFEAIEKMHRDILSRAVYEEWYFRKLTESRIKRELDDEIQKKRGQELEWIKLERRRRAEENFEKWKTTKTHLQKEKQKEGSLKVDKHPSPYAEMKPGAEKAFEAWKAKKDEEMKAKASIKKRMAEEEKIKREKEEQKAAADAAFKAWKQQVDEELRHKLKEREREKKVAETKKENEMKEKKENATSCYLRWKNNKDQKFKKNLLKNRMTAMRKAQEKTMMRTEKEYEAAQAFEEWLDKVDEREEKVKTKIHSLKNEITPWYPG